ncbi:MAG: hypothetical protein DSZ03_02990, partial [Sulfurimonas sp.]
MKRRELLGSLASAFTPKQESLIRPPYFGDESRAFEQECIRCDGRCATVCEEQIIQMGDDAYRREDMTIPWCKKGDHVMFGKYAGHRFKYGKSELRIMNDDEILAIVP